jgi:hypothetical protein
VEPFQNVVEDFVQRYRAFVASFGCPQVGSNIGFKLFFGYTGWDRARGCPPLLRFFTMLHDHPFNKKVESLQTDIQLKREP